MVFIVHHPCHLCGSGPQGLTSSPLSNYRIFPIGETIPTAERFCSLPGKTQSHDRVEVTSSDAPDPTETYRPGSVARPSVVDERSPTAPRPDTKSPTVLPRRAASGRPAIGGLLPEGDSHEKALDQS